MFKIFQIKIFKFEAEKKKSLLELHGHIFIMQKMKQEPGWGVLCGLLFLKRGFFRYFEQYIMDHF